MSQHEVKVVKIPAIEKHPNADQLGLVEVNGFTVVVRLDQWKEGDLAVFVEPDYVVPTDHELFAFLGKGNGRIKTRRFRGIWSMGLLVPAAGLTVAIEDEHTRTVFSAQEGDDVMRQLGIVRYEPEVHGKTHVVSGREVHVPEAVRNVPKYDLENLRKYRDVFQVGEEIVVTEKIHGANARFTFRDGVMYLGSRTRWVEDDGTNSWSQALANCPWIREVCQHYEGETLFGEIYGRVQSLHYGLPDKVLFRSFDAQLVDGRFVDAEELFASDATTICPVVYQGPFISFDHLMSLTEGPTMVHNGAGHIREGVVVKPARERYDRRLGRVALKLVSNAYLEKDY